MSEMKRRAFFQTLFATSAAAGSASVLQAAQQREGEKREEQNIPYQDPVRSPRTRAFRYTEPVDDIDKLAHQVAVVGVPFDLGTTFRPGARFGPQALRGRRGWAKAGPPRDKWPGYYDLEEEERYLENVSLADVGNVNIMPTDFMPNFDRITDTIKRIVARGAMPVALGGDHSITFPLVRGFEGIEEPIHIIHFDSHLDFSEGGGFVRHAHGNPMRRSMELSWISGLSSLGIRGLAGSNRDYEKGQEMGVQVIPALKMLRTGIKEAVASIPDAANYYISFDVDVISPSLLTGTGTTVPGGLTYYQAKEALQEVAKKNGKIVGYDFVEMSPVYEVSDISSTMAARLIIDFMGAIFKHQGDRHPQPAASDANSG